MPIDEAKVDELERQWRDARNVLLQENGRRYVVLKRLIPQEEMKRYLEMLEDKQEKILFGLELPDEPKRRGRKPGLLGVRMTEPREGADQTCPFCGKTNLTERGLKLHVTRMHKGEELPEEDGEVVVEDDTPEAEKEPEAETQFR